MTRPFYAFDSSFQGGEVYIKKLLAIIVLVPVACTNARCTTTSQVRRHSTTFFLENYLAAYKNEKYSDSSIHVQTWALDWINSTSARLQFTELNKTTNRTVNAD